MGTSPKKNVKRLAQILARRARITDAWNGWDGAQPDSDGGPPRVPQGASLGSTIIQLGDRYEGADHDCAFIAAAPADIDWLLAKVASLTGRLVKQNEELAETRALAELNGARLTVAEAAAKQAEAEERVAKNVVRVLLGVGNDAMLVEKVKALLNETSCHERTPAFTKLGAALMADSFYDFLADAPNFMSAKLTNGIMVTARRATGQTPEEVAHAAVKEARELRARVQELELRFGAGGGDGAEPVCQNCGSDPT